MITNRPTRTTMTNTRDRVGDIRKYWKMKRNFYGLNKSLSILSEFSRLFLSLTLKSVYYLQKKTNNK
jgi:hypothetical protein